MQGGNTNDFLMSFNVLKFLIPTSVVNFIVTSCFWSLSVSSETVFCLLIQGGSQAAPDVGTRIHRLTTHALSCGNLSFAPGCANLAPALPYPNARVSVQGLEHASSVCTSKRWHSADGGRGAVELCLPPLLRPLGFERSSCS